METMASRPVPATIRSVVAHDLGHLIRVARQLHVGLRGDETTHGLTPAQFAVLLALSRMPGADQGKVAAISALDKSSVSEIVRRLVARGYIEARPDPSDGRKQSLHATGEAVKLVTSYGRSLQRADAEFLAPLSLVEQTWLLTQMRLIAFSRRPDMSLHTPSEVPDGLSIAETNWAMGRLIRIALQTYNAAWTAQVGSVVSPVGSALLRVLVEAAPADQRSLGEALSLDKASMAGLVARLSEQRYVESSVDPGDRRRKIVRATSKGTDIARLVAPARTRVNEDVLEPIEPHNREPFLALLCRVTIERPGPA